MLTTSFLVSSVPCGRDGAKVKPHRAGKLGGV
jgi:hypothetical protein